MLLTELGVMQYCDMVDRWNACGVAWTTREQTVGAVYAYLHGQSVGRHPVYDGMCAYCGNLLYGTVDRSPGNKFSGPPVTIDGTRLHKTRAEGMKHIHRDLLCLKVQRARPPIRTTLESPSSSSHSVGPHTHSRHRNANQLRSIAATRIAKIGRLERPHIANQIVI